MHRTLLFLAFLAIAAFISRPATAAEIPLQADPGIIQIGTFYNGMDIALSGDVPAGSEIVLRFTGARGELHMKLKGKAFGLLWMNTGSVAFDDTPNVFIVSSTLDLETLAAQGNPEAAGIGLKGLAGEIQVESEGEDAASMVQELIKLKKSEKLYMERTGEIAPGATVDGVTPFVAHFRLPSRLSPGEYTLEAFALRGGEVVANGSLVLQAELVGLPKFIARLAFQNGALFGVLATIAALLGGLAIGHIFRGGSKGGH